MLWRSSLASGRPSNPWEASYEARLEESLLKSPRSCGRLTLSRLRLKVGGERQACSEICAKQAFAVGTEACPQSAQRACPGVLPQACRPPNLVWQHFLLKVWGLQQTKESWTTGSGLASEQRLVQKGPHQQHGNASTKDRGVISEGL